MLITRAFPVLPVPGNALQNELLHHPSGTGVVLLFPKSSFLPSMKTEVALALLQFLQSPQSFKYYQEQCHDDISGIPQDLWVHPIRDHGVIFVQLP